MFDSEKIGSINLIDKKNFSSKQLFQNYKYTITSLF